MDNESITKLIKPGHEIINEYQNMRVKVHETTLGEIEEKFGYSVEIISKGE